MGKYIQWKDVTVRYGRAADKGGSDELESFVTYAEADVEAALAGAFAVPFSSNNLTVKDLCIDLSFAKMIQFTDTKKFTAINSAIYGKIDKLNSGYMAMAVDTGDNIFAGASAYSTTQDFHNTFDMNDPEDQWVDPYQQETEYFNKI